MAFSLKTENADPKQQAPIFRVRSKTHTRHFSCRPENAYRGLRVENLGRRFYSPGLGRWLSRDPIGERGGVNLFAFVGNDSVSLLDFLGLTKYAIYWYKPDTANFEAAALSKKVELDAAAAEKAKENAKATPECCQAGSTEADTITISSYSGRITPNADIVYVYSHGNESGPNGYGVSWDVLEKTGVPNLPAEYADFENVTTEIHFMGCNIGRDYDEKADGNQSFARYLADYLKGKKKTVSVFASPKGTQIKKSSPSGKLTSAEIDSLLQGKTVKKMDWRKAINCGHLKVEYVSDAGAYSQY